MEFKEGDIIVCRPGFERRQAEAILELGKIYKIVATYPNITNPSVIKVHEGLIFEDRVMKVNIKTLSRLEKIIYNI